MAYTIDMQAVVSLLDAEHCQKLESVWRQLREEFGAESKYTRFLPHFTYQIAEAYHQPDIGHALKTFAANQQTCKIQTAGLGVFTRPRSVVYLPVIRNTELTLLHHRVWQVVQPHVTAPGPMYHPDRWLPHITLAYGDLPRVTRFQIIEFLAGQELDWDITVNNISLIDDGTLDNATEYHYHFANTNT